MNPPRQLEDAVLRAISKCWTATFSTPGSLRVIQKTMRSARVHREWGATERYGRRAVREALLPRSPTDASGNRECTLRIQSHSRGRQWPERNSVERTRATATLHASSISSAGQPGIGGEALDFGAETELWERNNSKANELGPLLPRIQRRGVPQQFTLNTPNSTWYKGLDHWPTFILRGLE